ncbi:MAG: hypothetical protein J2P47_06970, partial [Acetobacteraceae bacterium]|nr:hypothetical protein [Acetobacteraceae bacterium]
TGEQGPDEGGNAEPGPDHCDHRRKPDQTAAWSLGNEFRAFSAAGSIPDGAWKPTAASCSGRAWEGSTCWSSRLTMPAISALTVPITMCDRTLLLLEDPQNQITLRKTIPLSV